MKIAIAFILGGILGSLWGRLCDLTPPAGVLSIVEEAAGAVVIGILVGEFVFLAARKVKK